MADDIGEALNLVIGLAQIGGAFVDGGFQIEVVVAQLALGAVAGARRAPYQEDRNRGQRDHEAGADHGHDRRQLLGAIGGPGALREQLVLFGAHVVDDVVHALGGIAGGGLAHHRDAGLAASWRFDEIDGFGELVEPGVERLLQPFHVVDLHRIVAAQLPELVGVGDHGGRRDLIFGAKARLGGQEKAAGGAFGAADFQQQGVHLVFHLDRVNHPAIVLAGLIDEHHGGVLIATSTKKPAESSRI